MELSSIMLYIFILLVLIYSVLRAFSSSTQLTKMSEGKILQIIKANDIKNEKNSTNFTYSMWLYIDDWNYKYGQDKMVLKRLDTNNVPCPSVALGKKPNTLTVKVSYFDGNGSDTSGTVAADTGSPATKNAATLAACDACSTGYSCACAACVNGVPNQSTPVATPPSGAGTIATAAAAAATAAVAAASAAAVAASTKIHECMVDNIPIQKWVNVIVSLYGRTLDIYIDGKLVRTCVVPGVVKVNNNSNLQVTPSGGFSGWTTNFNYWAYASNPQEAYNIYKDGFGGSILGNLLNKYRLRFSIISDNEEKGSFEI